MREENDVAGGEKGDLRGWEKERRKGEKTRKAEWIKGKA